MFTLNFKHNITNIEIFEMGKTKHIKGLLVALSNCEIKLYNERQIIYTLECDVLYYF